MKPQYLWVLVITFLPAVSLADIHKCLVDGKTVYTDQECAENKAVPFQLTDINTTASTAVSYKGSIWLKDNNGYSIASDASVTENTPVLIYGYTDWCPYCKKLDSIYLNDYKVSNVLSKFIKVKLNPEHSSKDKQLFNSMGGAGYPSLFIQYPGQSPQKIRTPSFKSGEASSNGAKEKFIAMLQTHLKPFEKPPEEKTAP